MNIFILFGWDNGIVFDSFDVFVLCEYVLVLVLVYVLVIAVLLDYRLWYIALSFSI